MSVLYNDINYEDDLIGLWMLYTASPTPEIHDQIRDYCTRNFRALGVNNKCSRTKAYITVFKEDKSLRNVVIQGPADSHYGYLWLAMPWSERFRENGNIKYVEFWGKPTIKNDWETRLFRTVFEIPMEIYKRLKYNTEHGQINQ